MITKQTFEQLVSDFEYEVIDSWTDGLNEIRWSPEDETCIQYSAGEEVRTGSFERLLQYFVDSE